MGALSSQGAKSQPLTIIWRRLGSGRRPCKAAPNLTASWEPRAAITSAAGAWAIQGFGMFSVLETATGRLIGRVGPVQPEGWPGTEIGWALARQAWGRGYAVEAASAAMTFAFDRLRSVQVI